MRKLLVTLLALAFTLFATSSFAIDACNEATDKAKQQIDDVYLPKLDLWIKVSKALQDKGLDPRKYPVIMPDGTVEILDILDVIEKLALQRASGHGQIDQAKGDCEKKLKPFQSITDIAVLFATGGLSLVLPDRMTHVDASKILSGTPLGGAGALIPKAREDILKGLGVGGDVAKIIRDPKCIIPGVC